MLREHPWELETAVFEFRYEMQTTSHLQCVVSDHYHRHHEIVFGRFAVDGGIKKYDVRSRLWYELCSARKASGSSCL